MEIDQSDVEETLKKNFLSIFNDLKITKEINFTALKCSSCK